MERKIGIDTGKYMTKAAMRRIDGTDRLLEFRTKVDALEMDGGVMLNPAESHVVELNGRRYVVGEAAHSTDIRETTKASDIHRIAAYTAVAMLVDSGDEVDIAMGCPLSVFTMRERVAEYREYIFPGDCHITIVVDGMKKSFHIKSAQVIPEGSGVILLDPERYGDGVCGVIDIGGLNCNCMMVRNSYPVLRSMFTNSIGGSDLYMRIRRRLQAALETELMDEVLEQDIIRGYDIADREKSSRIISECKELSRNNLSRLRRMNLAKQGGGGSRCGHRRLTTTQLGRIQTSKMPRLFRDSS